MEAWDGGGGCCADYSFLLSTALPVLAPNVLASTACLEQKERERAREMGGEGDEGKRGTPQDRVGEERESKRSRVNK